jgi:hypothetical protein
MIADDGSLNRTGEPDAVPAVVHRGRIELGKEAGGQVDDPLVLTGFYLGELAA